MTKRVTKKDLEALEGRLWRLEDFYNDYDSLIRSYGGHYAQVKTRPVRLEIFMFDYDEEEYAAVVLEPQKGGGVAVFAVDMVADKTVAKGKWKDLGGDPVKKIWNMFKKIDSAHDVWDSYRS